MEKAKTVLVTGASRGIGRACALKFAQKGHRVIINYNKSASTAKTLEQEIINSGGFAFACQADVSNSEQVRQMFDIINERFGGVDILINNAGIANTKPFCDINEAEWDELFNVNIKGMFNCTKAVLDYMIKKKCGKIVNISSIWGICGASCEVAYSASKAAVIGFSKALASELGPSGICVNCVAPGIIDTDMNASICDEDKNELCNQTPLCRMGSADEIANAVYFLASDEASFITGQIISPNGGFVI